MKKILLDTHLALWAITDDEKLPETAREILLTADNEIYYSTASVWEISLKHSLHPDHMPVSAAEFSEFCRRSGYIELPIENRHVFMLDTLQRPETAPRHKDPFDRILIAQAKAEEMLFLTHDSLLPFYHEDCIIPV